MSFSYRRVIGTLLTAVAVALASPARGHADDRADIEAMRREIQELRRRDEQKQREIDALKQQVQRLHGTKAASAKPAPADALDQAVQDVAKPSAPAAPLDRAVGALASAPSTTEPAASSTALFSRRVGKAEIKLIDVSFDSLLAAGTSTATDSQISELEGGGHDPQRRGFTLQQAELSFAGAVDPYFTAEAHIVYTPNVVELEEAYFTTTSLPANLQVKGGYFLTEFGRINPTHPHAWDWIDQPIVNTRMFGGDGLRSPGARVSWLSPLPWYSELQAGVQNSNEGEFTTSFIGEESVGGYPVVKTAVGSLSDMLYLARWSNSWNWNDSLTTVLGFSGLFGPNSTGADGRTYLYGSDMLWKWQPPDNFRGWPFLKLQSEFMKRDYTADHFMVGTAAGDSGGGHTHSHGTEEPADEEELTGDIPGRILRDWGLYTQLLWGFHYGWAAGVRYEYASGSGSDAEESRQADYLRSTRHRVSPLIVWQPSEYSRLRLQYNFDHADFLPSKDASSVWFGVEVLYGAHPAHQY